jgi:adenylate cyclase
MNRVLGFWMTVLFAGGGAGILYSLLFKNGEPVVGFIFGIATAALLLGFERQLLLADLRLRIKRLSAPVYGLVSLAIFVALIFVANFVAGSFTLLVGLSDDPFWYTVIPTSRVTSYSLLVAAVIAFLLRMSDLIGREIFVNLLLGRYHRPVEEERVFLFIDLVGSTRIAEQMGPMRYQQFLGFFFASMADPVRDNRGSLDDYIGDMAMITWPMARGIKNAHCLQCVCDLQHRIERDREIWISRYGVLPAFRAAIHAGPVVTAEIGVEKHKITYVGDTVNATARLEELGKALKEPILISADVFSRLAPDDRFLTRDLGEHPVRGRHRALGVLAVTPA